jgi:hypothetical protein
MKKTSTPDWITRIAEERTSTSIQRLRLEGPVFWSQLIRELERNTDNLSEIAVRGCVTETSKPEEEEQRYRVAVAQKDRARASTYTDLFYVRDNAAIFSRTLENDQSTFRLCISPDRVVGVMPDDKFETLSAETLAVHIVKDAVERLEIPR